MKFILCSLKNFFRKSHRGFTFIELIMLISILGFMVMSINPHIFSEERSLAHGALLKVVSDIRYAQQLALSSGDYYGFRTITTTSYEIYRWQPNYPITNPTTQTPFIYELGTDYGTSFFEDSNYRIEFGPDGSPTRGAGSTYFISIGNGNIRESFTVELSTGLLDIL